MRPCADSSLRARREALYGGLVPVMVSGCLRWLPPATARFFPAAPEKGEAATTIWTPAMDAALIEGRRRGAGKYQLADHIGVAHDEVLRRQRLLGVTGRPGAPVRDLQGKLKMIRLFALGLSQPVIAERFGTTVQAVSQTIKRRRYYLALAEAA